MIRVFNVYFPKRTLFLAASEGFLIFLALLAASYTRLGGDTFLTLFYEQGFYKIAIASGVCVLCMYYYDLYDLVLLSNSREVITRLFQVMGTACVILSILYYAYPMIRLGRGIFVIGIFFVGISLAGCRRLFFLFNSSARLVRRAVVLGDGPLATSLARELEKRPHMGVRLVGYLGSQPALTQEMDGLRHLGRVEDLPALVEGERIEQVIVTMRDGRGRLPVAELLQLKACGVLVQDGADFYEAATGRVPIDSLRLSWLLFSPGFHLSRGRRIYKRIASLILASAGLVFSFPVMALVALAIRLDSAGPVIFRQRRVGKDGKLFTLYKFRSMRQDADGDGQPRPAQEKDARFTRVGRWLRRTRLDELPQIYNILRGDIYFIGPRPFTPNIEEELAEQIPFYRQRLTVKPGATGWAQVNRGYCETLEDNVEKLGYDLFYIKNVSVGLDLLILFRTIKILLLGRGAR